MLARSKATHQRLPIPAADANRLLLKDIQGEGLSSARRFAVAETLSHLERLVREGRARRHEADGTVSYTAART